MIINSRPSFMIGKINGNGVILGKVVKNNTTYLKKDLIQVLDNTCTHIFKKGYTGYIFQKNSIPKNVEEYLQQNEIPYMLGFKTNYLISEDLIELNSERNSISIIYKGDSYENVLLLTNQCNCNCVMCPDSVATRSIRKNIALDKIKKMIRLMKKDTPYLCITGGEPTLLKNDLLEILDECKKNLNYTQFLILTNGRMFYYKRYVEKFIKYRPNNMIIAIPIHGHTKEIHDKITQSLGSYKQTIKGIENLHSLGEIVEIRIVVNKLNYLHLVEISKLIIDKFPNVFRVNIMGMEMLGNAIINCKDVWIDYDKVQEEIIKASNLLLKSGINTYLYNFPLCYVDQRLWSITVKSISKHKVKYANECSRCIAINKCGGFFNSTMNLKKIKVRPILGDI